jgi:hypothetical protein
MMAFHGVIQNIVKHVKHPIKDFFPEQWLDSSQVYKEIFTRKIF